MFLPTASKLSLARACTFPWSGGKEWAQFAPSPFADYGNAVHAVCDALVKGNAPHLDAIAKTHSLSATDKRRLERTAATVADFLASEAEAFTWRASEVPLAYHLTTGAARALKTRGARDYSDVKNGEMSCTVDFVGAGPGYLVVRDWKTGRQSNVDPVATNAQMQFCALAAARHYGASLVRVELAFIDEADVYVDHAMFDDLDFGECAAELTRLVERIGRKEPPAPGHHCGSHYCPIVASCPATTAALAAVDSASELQFPLSVEIASAEHATHTRHRLKVVRDACDKIETALKNWIRTNGPIPAGDGKVYGVRESTRETIDLAAKDAYVTLVRHLGEDGAGEAVTLSTTKAAIHAAVVAKSPKGQYRATEEALLDELRELGAVRVSSFEKLEEYKSKETTR